MDLLTIVLIGIGLAMDCFAVALARGSQPGIDRARLALVFAAVFGLFQAGMTVLGWGAGSLFMAAIAPYARWAAFVILSAIGLKMVAGGLKTAEPGGPGQACTLPACEILLLAVATSLDALAAGLGFAFLDTGIVLPAITIGVIAAVFAVAGVFLGTKLETILGNRIEIPGGLILIAIGIRILAGF